MGERILKSAARLRARAQTRASTTLPETRVGPGTLYRHFPTRGTSGSGLLTEMEKLALAEQKFAAELPPIARSGPGCCCFADYIAAKQLIAPALNALVKIRRKYSEASYAQIQEALYAQEARDKAVTSGKDLDAMDPAAGAGSASPTWPSSPTGSRAPGDYRYPHHRLTPGQIGRVPLRGTLRSAVFRQTDGFLRDLLKPVRWVAAQRCPAGEFRERAAELAFETGDVGAVTDVIELSPASTPYRCCTGESVRLASVQSNRSTERLGQDLRRLRHHQHVGEIDLRRRPKAAARW